MNSISLTQVSAFVAAVCMASFFVNADDELFHNHERSTAAQIEQTLAEEPVEAIEESNDRFTFTSLDTDKNGKLSQKEVEAGKNEWLVKSFKQIDSNADKSITEQELVDYVYQSTEATMYE